MIVRVKPRWLLLVLYLGLSACSSSPDQNADDSQKQVLKLTIGASPQTLDPHQVTEIAGYKVLAALSEPLLLMDYNSFTVYPGVAEKWEVLNEGLRYRFHLRDDARWSNGEQIVAADFVFSFQRILSPKLGNQYATDYFAIEGSQSYFSGETKDFMSVGVKSISDHVLEFTLTKIDPLFLKRLASVNTAPVNSKIVRSLGALDDPSNPWVHAGNFVGNGPFILTSWQLNKKIEVIKNPYYWDADAIKLDGIEFNLADTESVEERLFRTHKIHLAYGGRVAVDKLEVYRREQPDLLVSYPSYATYYYLFNTQKPPFDNVNVRKAFALAIDRQLLIQSITKNSEKPALSLSPSSESYQPPEMPPYNPQLAQDYLSKAGYPEGAGFPPVKLLYNSAESHRKIAVAIQQMWKGVLNVDVELANLEWKVFLNERHNLQFDIARAGQASALGDPADFLGSFVSNHGMNDTGWGNSEFDRLLMQSSTTVNETERLQLLRQGEALLLDDMPLMPLFYYTNSYLVSPQVKGFQFNLVGLPDFRGVYLDATQEY